MKNHVTTLARRMIACTGLTLFFGFVPNPAPGATEVVTWGYNLGSVPADLTNAIAIGVRAYSVTALRADGTVAQWGNNATDPEDGTNFVTLTTGWHHALGFRPDGSIGGWGEDEYNVLTDIPAWLTNAAGLGAGMGFSFAIRPEGSVVAWGNNDYGALNLPAELTNVVSITASDYFHIALRADGTVVEWSGYSLNYTNLHPELSNVVAVATGGYAYAALLYDGSVVTTAFEVPEGLTNIAAIAAGGQTFLALRRDGTVRAWGCYCNGGTAVPPGLTNVSAIAMAGSDGYSHGMALIGLPPPTAPVLALSVSNGLPRLKLMGTKYNRYVLEETSDLNSGWSFSRNVLVGVTAQETVTLPPPASARFYRARWQP